MIREDPTGRGLLYAGTETRRVRVAYDDGGALAAALQGEPARRADPRPGRQGHATWSSPPTAARSGSSTTSRRCTRWRIDRGRRRAPLRAPSDVRWRAYRGHGVKPGPGREVAYRLAGSLGYAYRQITAPTGEKTEPPLDAGENPPNGVIVHYWLKEAPPRRPHSQLPRRRRPRDPHLHEPATSTAVRSRAASTPEAGGGEEPSVTPTAPEPATTRSRAPPRTPAPTGSSGTCAVRDATKLPDNKGRGGTLEMLTAPRVPPGAYQVRLSVNGRTLTQPFEIVKDPRVAASDADLREQFAWAKKSHDLLTRVHDAVLRLRDVRAQAEGRASPGRRRSRTPPGPSAHTQHDRERAHPGPSNTSPAGCPSTSAYCCPLPATVVERGQDPAPSGARACRGIRHDVSSASEGRPMEADGKGPLAGTKSARRADASAPSFLSNGYRSIPSV